jgi:hypothetical protein
MNDDHSHYSHHDTHNMQVNIFFSAFICYVFIYIYILRLVDKIVSYTTVCTQGLLFPYHTKYPELDTQFTPVQSVSSSGYNHWTTC